MSLVVTLPLLFLLNNICFTLSEVYTVVWVPSLDALCLLDTAFIFSLLMSAFKFHFPSSDFPSSILKLQSSTVRFHWLKNPLPTINVTNRIPWLMQRLALTLVKLVRETTKYSSKTFSPTVLAMADLENDSPVLENVSSVNGSNAFDVSILTHSQLK